MDKLSESFKKSEFSNTNKITGGGIIAWIKAAGHDSRQDSECINFAECGETSIQHDSDDGSSHVHLDN
jgi:hypothetical protein